MHRHDIIPFSGSHSRRSFIPCRISVAFGLGLAILGNWALPGSARGQNAVPRIGYVYPPAVTAGTTTEIQLGGYDWTPDIQVIVHDPRIKLELAGPPGELLVPPPPYWFGPKSFLPALPLPRETPARLVVPANTPPGLIRWQAANANGGTAVGTILIGNGREIIEQRIAEAPQDLPQLPVAVSGRLARIAEVDRYTLVAASTGPVTCELSDRLGQPFYGVLEVRDGSGRLVSDVAGTDGCGAALTFAAVANQRYEIHVHDVDFRGDRSFVYRLAVTPVPRVLAALPAGGQRGKTEPTTFLGIGLVTGAIKIESVTRDVSFSVAADVTNLPYRLETPFGICAPINLAVSDFVERTGNAEATSEKGQSIDTPGAVTGNFASASVHRYRCQWTKGQSWRISVSARPSNTSVDPQLRLRGPNGKELAANDDLPDTTDAGLDFEVGDTGPYTIEVCNMASVAGADRPDTYRLCVAPKDKTIDFELSVPAYLNITLGSRAELPVAIKRSPQFTGSVRLTIEGLPTGVVAKEGLEIPEKINDLKIGISSAPDAPALATLATLTATAPTSGSARVRQAKCLIAVTMKPRCRIVPLEPDGGRTVHRGTTFPADVIVERLEGFDGEIVLQQASQQSRHRQGIDGHDVTVPPGVAQIAYPIYLPEWLETSRTSRMTLIGIARVPDPQGIQRYVASSMQGQITMSIEGALLKVAHIDAERTERAGNDFEIPLKISRSAKLHEEVRLNLVLEKDMVGLLAAEPVVLPVDQDKVTLTIHSIADPRLVGAKSFKIRATAMQSNVLPVVSETEVLVNFTATN